MVLFNLNDQRTLLIPLGDIWFLSFSDRDYSDKLAHKFLINNLSSTLSLSLSFAHGIYTILMCCTHMCHYLLFQLYILLIRIMITYAPVSVCLYTPLLFRAIFIIAKPRFYGMSNDPAYRNVAPRIRYLYLRVISTFLGFCLLRWNLKMIIRSRGSREIICATIANDAKISVPVRSLLLYVSYKLR